MALRHTRDFSKTKFPLHSLMACASRASRFIASKGPSGASSSSFFSSSLASLSAPSPVLPSFLPSFLPSLLSLPSCDCDLSNLDCVFLTSSGSPSASDALVSFCVLYPYFRCLSASASLNSCSYLALARAAFLLFSRSIARASLIACPPLWSYLGTRIPAIASLYCWSSTTFWHFMFLRILIAFRTRVHVSTNR